MRKRVCDYCSKDLEGIHYIKVVWTFFNPRNRYDFCNINCAKDFENKQIKLRSSKW